jgi:hypothetical protein
VTRTAANSGFYLSRRTRQTPAARQLASVTSQVAADSASCDLLFAALQSARS